MPTSQRWAYFFALFTVALVLGPSLAHLLEMPNKIGLGRDAYFTVQAIYRGWALLGIVIAATLVLALSLRRARRARAWAAVAFLCLLAGQGLFWSFTFPANQATRNWTTAPADWERLRVEWEYSHAAAAVLNLAAMAALIGSVLCWKVPGEAGPAPRGAAGPAESISDWPERLDGRSR